MRAQDAAVGGSPGATRVCRWRSACWPAGSATTRSGLARPGRRSDGDAGPAGPHARGECVRRAAFDLFQDLPLRARGGCSPGSAWSPAPASTPTPPGTPAWPPPGASWMSCMTSTCWPTPPRAPRQYQLHDLLREHARALVAADDQPSDEAAGRLLDYYLPHRPGRQPHFTPWPSAYRRPCQAPPVAELDHATTWLEAERANLHAAAASLPATRVSLTRPAPAVAISGFLKPASLGRVRRPLPDRPGRRAPGRRGDRLGEADTLALGHGATRRR